MAFAPAPNPPRTARDRHTSASISAAVPDLYFSGFTLRRDPHFPFFAGSGYRVGFSWSPKAHPAGSLRGSSWESSAADTSRACAEETNWTSRSVSPDFGFAPGMSRSPEMSPSLFPASVRISSSNSRSMGSSPRPASFGWTVFSSRADLRAPVLVYGIFHLFLGLALNKESVCPATSLYIFRYVALGAAMCFSHYLLTNLT